MSTDDVDAAELLLRLSIFGFSQLSASDQLQETEEVRNKLVHQGVPVLEQLPEETEEDLRVRTFTELFKKLPFSEHDIFLSKVVKKFKREGQCGELVSWFSTQLDFKEQQEVIGKIVHVHKVGLRTRAAMLFEVSNKFFCERKLHDLTLLFRQLGSNGWKNLIEQLFDWLMETYYSSKYTKDVIIEKLSEESEEDFRVRRFIKLCTTHPSLCDQNEVAKWDLTSMLQTSGNREINKAKHDGISVSHNNFSSRYAEFYFGLSVIWFKTNKSGIHSIEVLLGEAEEGDTIEKLCGENEEDFRLQRFIESFNQLQVSSQEYIVKYILRSLEQNIYKEGGLLTAWLTYNDVFPTWFEDLPSALGLLKGKLVTEGVAEGPGGRAYSFEEDLPSALEFIKVKIPNLRGGREGGGGAAAQGRGGGGATAITGTSQQTGQ
ncbi:hypothetical protein ACFX2I_027136 [Malus domestica]